MSKSTRAIVNLRVEEVLRIRLDGAEFWDVMHYIAAKQKAGEPPWTVPDGENPIAERTVWWYIQQADELLKETFRNESGRARLRRRHLAQRRNLFAKAVSQGDLATALRILDSESRMLGLDDEISRQIKELRRKLDEFESTNPVKEGKNE